jgi:hypothetical protein
VAFHALVTRCPEGRVKDSVQESTGVEPVLATVTSAVKPSLQTFVA